MRDLYPAIAPYQEGTLQVSDLHTIAYEQSGNPQGKPIVLLHGGPGGGCPPFYRQYFHPEKWRLVMFDQRGCGKKEYASCRTSRKYYVGFSQRYRKTARTFRNR